MTKCYCCQSENYRYSVKLGQRLAVICQSCFEGLPQKRNFAETIHLAIQKGIIR